jgi:hypothetical protein
MIQTVEDQKTIASEVWHKLSLIDPRCQLVGGAPRDWFFGKKAKDLDFYFYRDMDYLLVSELNQILWGVGFSIDPHKKVSNIDLYESMADLNRIFNVCNFNLPVQLMQMGVGEREGAGTSGIKPRRVETVNNTLSQVWYDFRKGCVKASDNFMFSVEYRIVGVSDFNAPNIEKTKSYFPDYKFISMEDFNATKRVMK